MAKEIDVCIGGAITKVKKVPVCVGGAIAEAKKGVAGVGGAVVVVYESALVLYDNGINNGIEVFHTKGHSGATLGSLTFNDDHATLVTGNYDYTGIQTPADIDYSKYSKMFIELSTTKVAGCTIEVIGRYPNRANYNADGNYHHVYWMDTNYNAGVTPSPNTKFVIELDIPNTLTYPTDPLGVHLDATTTSGGISSYHTFNIYKVWLEE